MDSLLVPFVSIVVAYCIAQVIAAGMDWSWIGARFALTWSVLSGGLYYVYCNWIDPGQLNQRAWYEAAAFSVVVLVIAIAFCWLARSRRTTSRVKRVRR